MATARLDKNQHPNTYEENEKIIKRLRTRMKIDDRSGDELTKLFNKLNAKNVSKSSSIIQSPTRQDQLALGSLYGPIPGFPSGSWWGIRMDCSRDQVHVPFNKDIDEGPFGAISICTSHVNPSNDVDSGDWLTFTGAEYDEDTTSLNSLFRSYENRIPLRLVRGYNLANKFAPKTGYRYDGLYIIVSSWIGVSSSSKKNYKFALARLNYQEPPPWQPTPVLLEQKKTRNKSKSMQRCHMDCCRVNETKDKLDDIPITKLSVLPTLIKTPKQTKESTIVMRHVSKKSESVPGVESPILSYSPKPTSCKLQNTNISIRTDLYDSTPNHHQQDVKKTPMTFCRIYKSSTKPTVRLPVSTNSANAKEKMCESQIKMRCGIKNTRSPIINTGSVKNYSTPRNISSASESSSFLTNEFSNTESKDRDKAAVLTKKLLDDSVEVEGRVPAERRSSESSMDSMVKRHKIQKAVVELESMSPEQMVNLLVQQRYKKAGKLLIGSIIGDPGFMAPSDGNGEAPETITDKSVDEPAKVTKKASRTLYSLRSNSVAKKQVNESRDKPSKAKSKKETKRKDQTVKKVNKFSNAVAKKRRSELAKLAIDANFAMKTRGPRTRRFPYAIRGFKSKRRDNLRHLKGRTKVDLSKKTKSISRAAGKESKKPRIPRNSMKKTETIEHISRDMKRKSSPGLSNKLIERGTQKTMGKRLRMVDAMTQCTLQKDASTSVDFETISRNERETEMRIKWINVDEVKSESSESEGESLPEIYYRNSSVQTSGESQIVRPNCVRRSLDASARLAGELSAFAPVNMSDVEFRVARLRSIGFKPIDPCVIYANYSSSFNDYRESESSKGSSVGNVVRRDVNEQYKKYTSEENNIVGYMDDELRYQDIEDEEVTNSSSIFGGVRRRMNVKHDNIVNSGKGKVLRRKRKSNDSPVVDDEPWHGWKKFVQL